MMNLVDQDNDNRMLRMRFGICVTMLFDRLFEQTQENITTFWMR